MSKNISTFEFKYQGAGDAIDVNTLLVSQFQYAAMLNEIKKQLFPNVEMKIKIQSFQPGSFDVNQIIEIVTIGGLIVFDKQDTVAEIFKVLKGYIDIRKILSNKKPSSITPAGNGNVTITVNGDNNTVIIVPESSLQMYQQSGIMHKAVSKNAEILEKDNEIEGIVITDRKSNERMVEIGREDFPALYSENPYIDLEKKEKIIKDAILYIRKLEISPKKCSKWDFLYDGRKISSVLIKDEAFLKTVAQGKKFGNGDKLQVDLRIVQRLDELSGAMMDDKYEVLRVKNIIDNRQLDMFKDTDGVIEPTPVN